MFLSLFASHYTEIACEYVVFSQLTKELAENCISKAITLLLSSFLLTGKNSSALFNYAHLQIRHVEFQICKRHRVSGYFKDPSILWGSITTMHSFAPGKRATACLLYLSSPSLLHGFSSHLQPTYYTLSVWWSDLELRLWSHSAWGYITIMPRINRLGQLPKLSEFHVPPL